MGWKRKKRTKISLTRWAFKKAVEEWKEKGGNWKNSSTRGFITHYQPLGARRASSNLSLTLIPQKSHARFSLYILAWKNSDLLIPFRIGMLDLPYQIRYTKVCPLLGLNWASFQFNRWRNLVLLESSLVINIKHYRSLGGQQEITALNMEMVETRVRISFNSFLSSPIWHTNKAVLGPTWGLTVG